MQIELIFIFVYFFTKSPADRKDGRCRKENRKELLPSGCCCFACLQEVLVQISQPKALTKELQNAEVQPMCGIPSEDLRFVGACAQVW